MRLVDPLVSRLELRSSGLDLRAATTHEDRLILASIGWALRDPGTVVYDVGAALGGHTTAFAKMASVAEIVAFEPLAESYARLRRSTENLPHVRCFQLALGEREATLPLNRSAWRNTSSFLDVSDVTRAEFPLAARIDGIELVRVARLDDVVAEYHLPPPDVVKIDAQGYEDRVISGGSRTLAAARVCVIEVSFEPLYESSPLFDDVYVPMRDLGFRLGGFAGSLAAAHGQVIQADAVFVATTVADTGQ